MSKRSIGIILAAFLLIAGFAHSSTAQFSSSEVVAGDNPHKPIGG